MEHRRIVVIGGGFGGLAAVQAMRNLPVEITLVDRQNYHLFQPLLYEVATGVLSPANITATLRSVLKKQKNARVVLAEACGFDLTRKQVVMRDGVLPYDILVVAVGSHHHYFGNDHWEASAPGLKTLGDARRIRSRVLHAFESAERAIDPDEVRRWLTFVIVGGGPTGVELAGALAEIAHGTLRGEFRSIDPADARILLLEGTDRVLPTYPARLSERAREHLEELKVEVRTQTMVTGLEPGAVTIRCDDRKDTILAQTVLWGTGVKASPLGAQLASMAGLDTDRAGRVPVEQDLTLPGHPNIFVIGDLASASDDSGRPLPGIAPVAMQQGQYVARAIASRLRGQAAPVFSYRDFGTMATIGRHRAVAVLGPLKLTGRLAWFVWLFVHLMYIVEFQKRFLVLLQWAWHYFTWRRSARLITEPPLDLPGKNGTGEHLAPPENRRAVHTVDHAGIHADRSSNDANLG